MIRALFSKTPYLPEAEGWVVFSEAILHADHLPGPASGPSTRDAEYGNNSAKQAQRASELATKNRYGTFQHKRQRYPKSPTKVERSSFPHASAITFDAHAQKKIKKCTHFHLVADQFEHVHHVLSVFALDEASYYVAHHR